MSANDSWICETCGSWNELSNTVCEVCGAEKPSKKPLVKPVQQAPASKPVQRVPAPKPSPVPSKHSEQTVTPPASPPRNRTLIWAIAIVVILLIALIAVHGTNPGGLTAATATRTPTLTATRTVKPTATPTATRTPRPTATRIPTRTPTAPAKINPPNTGQNSGSSSAATQPPVTGSAAKLPMPRYYNESNLRSAMYFYWEDMRDTGNQMLVFFMSQDQKTGGIYYYKLISGRYREGFIVGNLTISRTDNVKRGITISDGYDSLTVNVEYDAMGTYTFGTVDGIAFNTKLDKSSVSMNDIIRRIRLLAGQFYQ